MADENIPKFYFYRTNATLVHNGIKGNRGILEAGGAKYFTIERDINSHVHIPFGSFPLNMEISPSNPGRKQFRIMNHSVYNNVGEYAALLIHVGNYPGELTGCIGPGKTINAGGVEHSQKAMDELFTLCGGFKAQSNAAILEVQPMFSFDVSRLKGVFVGNLKFQ